MSFDSPPHPAKVKHTPEQVAEALTLLAVNGGNYAKTADELRERDENPIEVRAAQLREWKTDTHTEQYRRISENVGMEMEDRAVQAQRRLINKADDVLEPLLERAADAEGDAVPAAMRAVADVKAKSSNALMQLTGRPTNGQQTGAGDIVDLLKHMVDRGYLNLAPDVQDSIEGTAEEA